MAVLGEVVTLLTLDISTFKPSGQKAIEIFKEISNSSRATRTAVNAVGSAFGVLGNALGKAGKDYEDIEKAAKGFQTVASGLASGGLLGGAIAGGVLLVNQLADSWGAARKAAAEAADAMFIAANTKILSVIEPLDKQTASLREQIYGLNAQLLGSSAPQSKIQDALFEQQERVATLREQAGANPQGEILADLRLQEGVLKRLEEQYGLTFDVKRLNMVLEAQRKLKLEIERNVEAVKKLNDEFAKQQRIQKIQLPTGPMNLQSGGLFSQKSLVLGGTSLTGGPLTSPMARTNMGLGTELESPLLQAANQATVDPAIAREAAEERRKLELVGGKALIGARGLDDFIVTLTKFPDFTEIAGDALSTLSTDLSKLFGEKGGTGTTSKSSVNVGAIAGSLIPVIGPLMDSIASKIGATADALGSIFGAIADSAENVVDAFVAFLPLSKIASSFLETLVSGAKQYIGNAAANIMDMVKQSISDPFSMILAPLRMVTDMLSLMGSLLLAEFNLFGDLISRTESYKTVQQGIENITSRVVTAYEPLMEVLYPVIGIFSVLAGLVTKLIAPFMQTGFIMSLLYNTTKLAVLNLLVVIHTFYRFQSTIALVANTLFKWVNDLTGGLAFEKEMNDWGETYNNAVGGMIDTAIAFDTINSSTMESMWELGRDVGKTDEEFKKLNSSITNMPRWYRTALAITNAGSAPTDRGKPGSSGNQSFTQVFNVETVTVGDPQSFIDQVANTVARRAYRTSGTRSAVNKSAKS